MDMRPGTLILSVQLNFTAEGQRAYSSEKFGYAAFDSIRNAAAYLIRVGKLFVDEISEGRAHVRMDEHNVQLVVEQAVRYRQSRREEKTAAA